MDAIIRVPTWAYDFCYYYLIVAIFVAVATVYSVVLLVASPIKKKIVPILTLLSSGVVTVVLTMMQFWVCRSALAPTTKQVATAEKFATMCANDKDCQAATSDTTATCTCGGRGMCTGCLYRNTQGTTGGDYAGFGGGM